MERSWGNGIVICESSQMAVVLKFRTERNTGPVTVSSTNLVRNCAYNTTILLFFFLEFFNKASHLFSHIWAQTEHSCYSGFA